MLAAVDAGRQPPHDLVVLRGRALVSAAARDGAFDGRLWSYLTDVPQAVPAVTPKAAEDLTIIAKASRYLLCQTEELRCFLEGSVAAACGKSVLFPPVLPALDIHRDPERTVAPPGTPLKLVYTGKFAPRWNTLEMTPLPALLAARGVAAEVHMVGDKVHDDPRDPTYKQADAGRARRGRRRPARAPGVIWHGGQPRAEAMRLAAAGDIGLSWRHPELDASLELSTKVLEFGQLGLPVILNRTPMHEALLGADYPLFAASARRRGRRGGGRARPRGVRAWRRPGRRPRPRRSRLTAAAARLRGVPGAGGAPRRGRCRRGRGRPARRCAWSSPGTT